MLMTLSLILICFKFRIHYVASFLFVFDMNITFDDGLPVNNVDSFFELTLNSLLRPILIILLIEHMVVCLLYH